MPAGSTHPQYKAREAEWSRCRDAYNGTDAVKARGQTYLPPLSSKHADYDGYLTRANFYPATSRTVEGLTGCVFRRPPDSANVPDTVLDNIQDLDLASTPINVLAMEAVRELLITGRIGIGLDVADGRVFWRFYRAEDILSWYDDGGGIKRVVLRERWMRPNTLDTYEIEEMARIRAMSIEDGELVVRQYAEAEPGAGADVLREEPRGRTRLRGRAAAGLPAVRVHQRGQPGGRAGQASAARHGGRQPLVTSARAADLEHALHWVALPTPWIATKDNLPTRIWPSARQSSGGCPRARRSACWRSSGAGIDKLADNLSTKVQQMAALGARLIADPARAAETAEAVRIKSGGDAATLLNVVASVDRGFAEAIRLHAQLGGHAGRRRHLLAQPGLLRRPPVRPGRDGAARAVAGRGDLAGDVLHGAAGRRVDRRQPHLRRRTGADRAPDRSRQC